MTYAAQAAINGSPSGMISDIPMFAVVVCRSTTTSVAGSGFDASSSEAFGDRFDDEEHVDDEDDNDEDQVDDKGRDDDEGRDNDEDRVDC
mmetsp:Transcript_8049/g.17426  ORF Transcript_8049/g.17426 Transcript_8049/m.17426 type:complete len:90 (+) Transcript_8049:824-1093(+)